MFSFICDINKNDDNLKGQFDSLFKATEINSDAVKSTKKYYNWNKTTICKIRKERVWPNRGLLSKDKKWIGL